MVLQNINMRLCTAQHSNIRTLLHVKCNLIKLQNSYQMNSMSASWTTDCGLQSVCPCVYVCVDSGLSFTSASACYTLHNPKQMCMSLHIIGQLEWTTKYHWAGKKNTHTHTKHIPTLLYENLSKCLHANGCDINFCGIFVAMRCVPVYRVRRMWICINNYYGILLW